MAEPLDVAVVGTGIGQAHLWALVQLPDRFRIATVCDIDEEAADQAADSYGAASTTEYESVLTDDDIDLVVLCTPPFLHESQTIAALAAGKHVVCEKPLAGSLAAIDRIEAASNEAARTVFPVFNYRYGPNFQQFLDLAGSGALGAPLIATAEVGFLRGADYYASPWRGTRAGELGGCLASHAIHHFDLLLAALGAPASTATTTATRVNDIETEDCAAGAIEFKNGCLATFAVTLGSIEQYSRLRLVYTNAVVEFSPGPYDTLTEEAWILHGVERPGPPERESGFLSMFREIHRALSGEDHRAPQLGEARRALELVTGMYRSAAEGGTTNLPLDDGSPWYHRWT